MKIHSSDVILSSVFDDEPLNDAMTKASFGGDRSAAGRYAAEQRWKNHQKKETTGGQGRSPSSDTRTTEQKLKDGPQTFAFGRDEKGLPVVGTIEQLEERFGKDITSQEKYFKDKYGLTVILSVGSGGKKRDTVDPKDTALVYARLASLQALDDICSNLTGVPAKLTVYVTPSIMPTGYSNANINGYVERNAQDTRLATLGVNIKTINDCVEYLSGKEFEYERKRDIEAKVNVRFMHEGEPSAVQAVTTNLKTASEKDRATIVARLAYGVMVHEWGHVLDLKGLWLSANQKKTSGFAFAPHSSTDFGDRFRNASSVSGYGSISAKSAPQEKMAEAFASWFLFSRSSNIFVPTHWDADGVRFSTSKEVDMKVATSKLMRPLLDERGDVVKQLGMGLDITKLLPTHPVLLFALQPFVNDGVVKARPENPWKRGYNTQYFRVRDTVLARKPLCYKCKKNRASEVDHVRPLINGGSNTVGNLRPICVSCNRKSGGGERRVRKLVRVDAMVDLAFEKASFGGDRSAAGRYAAEQRWKNHQKKEAPPQKVFTGFILDDIARYAAETVPKVEYLKLSIHDTDAGKALKTQVAKILESQHSPLELYVAHIAVNDLLSFAGGELYNVGHPADVALEKFLVMPEAIAAKTVEELVKVLESTPEYKAGDEGMISLWHGVSHPLSTPDRQFGAPSEKMMSQFVNIWTEGGAVGKGIWLEIIRQEFGIEEARQGKPESASAEITNEITDRHAGSMKVFRSAARAIYEQTQELLAGVLPAGTTHVQLYRGTGFTDEELKEANAGTVQISPITSFSDSRLRAYQFEAKSKVDTTKGLITAPVPVSQIFGLGTQGFGLIKEEEVVVMGPSLSNIKITLPLPDEAVGKQKMVVRRDAMIAAALAKASFGGDRSAAGRYAAEQRWKGHQKKDEMPKPTGFIGVRRPSERKIRDVFGKAPYPSYLRASELITMLEDDMAELNEQMDRIQSLGDRAKRSIESAPNRQTAKEVVVANLVKGVMASLPPEVLQQGAYELNRNPDDPPVETIAADTPFQSKGRANLEELVSDSVNQIIGQWAQSSNDHLRLSLAIQQVTERVFGLRGSAPASVVSDTNEQQEEDAKVLSDPKSAAGKFIEAVVRQQYANTQAYFEAKGIKEVTLYRGKDDENLRASLDELNRDRLMPDGTVRPFQWLAREKVTLRPLSSFTADKQTATDFTGATKGVVLVVKIPVTQVFATPFTGIGCLPETEFVVLGKPTTARVQEPYAD